MGEPLSKSRRRLSLFVKLGALGGVNLGLLLAGTPLRRIFERAHEWWWSGYEGWPSGGAVHRVIDLVGHGFAAYLMVGFFTVFATSVALVPLALLGRTLARARVRAGGTDAFEPARRWVATHPGRVRLLSVVPATLWALLVGWDQSTPWADAGEQLGALASFGIVGVLAAAGLTSLTRAGIRSLVAPILEDEPPLRVDLPKDEISFDAVAVTGETRAAVALMAALSVGAFVLALSSEHAFRDPQIVGALVAYALAALGGAALFRNGSKVAVGVDGVLVRGTSRTRFFPYRELDAARVEGSDLELVRKDRVVLRLQLHGEDASKRTAVLARIREAIDVVKEGRSAASAHLVSAASPAELARAAGGGADYRAAALTREQLWALIEGPESAEDARRAAAEAIAKTSSPDEKARLRVAAEHCAAPTMRVALERLAAEAAFEDEGPTALAAARRAL